MQIGLDQWQDDPSVGIGGVAQKPGSDGLVCGGRFVGKGDARTTVGSQPDRGQPRVGRASQRPSTSAGHDGGRGNKFPRKVTVCRSIRAIALWALRGCASAACRHSKRAVANFTISKKNLKSKRSGIYIYDRGDPFHGYTPSPRGAAAPPAVATGGPAGKSRPVEWRAC